MDSGIIGTQRLGTHHVEAYAKPEQAIPVIGVTGTNGKSSTVWIIKELCRSLGIKCLSIGTLGAYLDEEHLPTIHTTPDPDALYQFFRYGVDQGAQLIVIEASSHAIKMEKLGPITFSAVGFTSFSRDHLDFHASMDDYLAEKTRLFLELSNNETRRVICNKVDHGPLKKDDFIEYGDGAQFSVTVKEQSLSGTKVIWNDTELHLPLFGQFLIENATCALLLLEPFTNTPWQNWPWHGIQSVPGRLEAVSNQPGIIVDYAHTPDALEKALQVVRPLCNGKLWVVFGCGGDRDPGKRPEMGRVAETFADKVVVTSDNPRTEDPEEIIQNITSNMNPNTLVKSDREEAIRFAVQNAAINDIVLIAGKGHETYQIIGDRKIDFDDRLVAKKYLEQR